MQYNDRDFMYWCDYCRRYIKSTINDPPRRSDQTSDYNENYYEESSTAGGSYKIAGGILAILGIMFGGIGYFFTTASGEELMPWFLDLVLIFILTFVFTGAGWWLYNRGLEKEYSHKYSRTPGYSY